MGREGYVYLRDALIWMGGRAGRDLDVELGGVLGPGRHHVTCVEKIGGKGYTDYIFQDPGGARHRERSWRKSWELGEWYEVELGHGPGDAKIHVDNAGGYSLISTISGKEIHRASTMREIYEYKDRNGLKLSYLGITSCRKITRC